MARDTSFSYSFLVLPRDKRRAIGAVWDFCRAVDDEVDEAGENEDPTAISAGLVRWRRELDACFDGGVPSTPPGRALQPWIARFGLPRAQFHALIDGVAMDVDRCRYATFGELEQYCLRVASAVGLICLEIFGYRNPDARGYATNLGLALQLTNILRDVASDARRGRLYIPLDEVARFDVAEGALQNGQVTPPVRALLGYQAARCRDYFARARASLPREDAKRLVAAEIMRAIYEAILSRIEARRFDVFSERIRVPRPARALIALRTWARVMLQPQSR
jgi:phytoene synthase